MFPLTFLPLHPAQRWLFFLSLSEFYSYFGAVHFINVFQNLLKTKLSYGELHLLLLNYSPRWPITHIADTIRFLKDHGRTVIYDAELSATLPVSLSVTSGINAIAHAAEGLYAHDGNPVMDLMAEEGIAAIGRVLPQLRQNASDMDARSDALYGAWLCGTVLGHIGMALHHKLCHTLGGSFNLPHAETHTIVLPHALAYNATAAPKAMTRIARALNADSAPQAVFRLSLCNGGPVALRDIGMREQDLDRACDLALQNQYPNPRPLERGALRQLLQNAYEGVQP